MNVQRSKKHKPGAVLLGTFPVAKYLGLLLISLNIGQLPRQTWILPGMTASRLFFTLWIALFLGLSLLADRRARIEQKNDQVRGGTVLNLLSFLALAVPGLLLVDALAILHIYLSWYKAGAVLLQPSLPQTACMAAGCVLWIYAQSLPALSFGSIWGIRTARTLASPAAWSETHRRARPLFRILSLIAFAAGILLLI